MAILAIYPYAKTLHVAAWDQERTQTATFLLSNSNLSEKIRTWLNQTNIKGSNVQFIVTSAHLAVQSVPDGIYLLPDSAIDSKKAEPPQIACELAKEFKCPIYLVDPSGIDQCLPQAHVTGTPEIKRRCTTDNFIFKYLALQEAKKRNLNPKEGRFIICHLDAEHQMGVLVGTQAVDCLTSLDEGPFALNHSGSLPFDRVIDLCISSKERDRAFKTVDEDGGLKGYLGLPDLSELFSDDSDHAELIRNALVYQISKEIGAFATVLHGKVDSIILAGELASSDDLVNSLKRQIGFLAPISLHPGNQVIAALLAGAKSVIDGEPILNFT